MKVPSVAFDLNPDRMLRTMAALAKSMIVCQNAGGLTSRQLRQAPTSTFHCVALPVCPALAILMNAENH